MGLSLPEQLKVLSKALQDVHESEPIKPATPSLAPTIRVGEAQTASLLYDYFFTGR